MYSDLGPQSNIFQQLITYEQPAEKQNQIQNNEQ